MPDTMPSADDGVYPAHWSEAARDAVEHVLEARPGLVGAEFAALTEAANLISTADGLDVVARESSYMSVGSAGQPVVHPAVTASTTARAAAATILARLTVAAGPAAAPSTASSRAQRAATARWQRARA